MAIPNDHTSQHTCTAKVGAAFNSPMDLVFGAPIHIEDKIGTTIKVYHTLYNTLLFSVVGR